MRILGLDLETTGFDTANDRITEVGAVLWETDTKKPLVLINDYLYDASYAPLSDEVVRVTGITDEVLKEFGTAPGPGLERLDKFCAYAKVEYIVAHNGENFDKPLLMSELVRNGLEAPVLRSLPWIDTRNDIPFGQEPDSRKLKHLAGDHGFLNPFAHRALFDVLTMLKVLSQYDIEKVIEYSKIPFITVRAVVSYDDRQLAKDRRFSWEKLGTETYPKWWVKKIKMDQLEKEAKDCPFQIVEIKNAQKA